MDLATFSVRRRIPWFRLAGILLVVSSTLASAAANMMPLRLPTTRQLRRSAQDEVSTARRARIAAHLALGDHCDADIARALARDLVFDGRSAAPYADDFEGRCGEDRFVRRWGNASRTLHLP